jgi:hypothetical protein
MKLQLLAMPVFLLSPTTAANCFRRHCRTLSASAKKPASLAGFLYLWRLKTQDYFDYFNELDSQCIVFNANCRLSIPG